MSEEVKFHEAMLDDTLPKATLVDGCIYKFDEGRRRVEVWRIKEVAGYAVRIYRPTSDGRVSRLEFSLSDDAAVSLLLCLQAHINTHAA